MATGSGLRAQLVRGAMGAGGLKLLSLPLTLLVSVLFARTLGPEGFGQYAFIITLTSVLSIPVGGSMVQLMTRETASLHHEENWGLLRGLLRWGHRWVLLGSVLIGGALAAIATSQATWQINDRWTMLIIAVFALPFIGLNALRAGMLAGLRRVVVAQLPELMVRPGVQLVVAGIILLYGVFNPATAILSYVVATLLAFLVGAALLNRAKPLEIKTGVACENSRDWLSAWLPFSLLVATSTLNAQIGILLLGWLGSNAEVAALQVADRGALLVVLSLSIVNMVIGPYITRAYREGDFTQLQLLSRQSARLALMIATPIAFCLIVFAAPIINIAFGVEYVNIATTPLIILSVAQLVNVAFGSVGKLLTMSGYERDSLYGQFVSLLVNVITAVLLIPELGAVGAAYAAAIGLITWNILLAIKVKSRLGLRPPLL